MQLPNFDNANCKDVDQKYFFPETQAEEIKNKPYIRMMCNGCSVFNECLDYSLAVMVDGIWAGNNKDERKAIRKARGMKAKALELSMGSVWQSQEASAIRQRKARAKK